MSENENTAEKIFGEGGEAAPVKDSPGTDDSGPDVVGSETDTPTDADSSHEGRAGISVPGTDIPRVPPAKVYELLKQGLNTAEIATQLELTVAEVEELLEPPAQATTVIDISDDQARQQLGSRVLKVAKRLVDIQNNMTEAQLSDPATAKAIETHIKALATVQNGIVDRIPKVFLETNNESQQLLEELGLSGSDT